MITKTGLVLVGGFCIFTSAIVVGTVKAMYGIRNWLDSQDPTELDEEDDS